MSWLAGCSTQQKNLNHLKIFIFQLSSRTFPPIVSIDFKASSWSIKIHLFPTFWNSSLDSLNNSKKKKRQKLYKIYIKYQINPKTFTIQILKFIIIIIFLWIPRTLLRTHEKRTCWDLEDDWVQCLWTKEKKWKMAKLWILDDLWFLLLGIGKLFCVVGNSIIEKFNWKALWNSLRLGKNTKIKLKLSRMVSICVCTD